MQKVYSIKTTYKDKTYILKGNFLTEDQIKNEIINRKIKDLTEISNFYIQYPEGISKLQEAYDDCKKYNKSTFKINIYKKKKKKNRESVRESVQNQEQLNPDQEIIDQQLTSVSYSMIEDEYKKSRSFQQQSSKQESPTVLKTTAYFENIKEQLSKDETIKEQELTSQLPNFDISQILEEPPLETENKLTLNSRKEQNEPKNKTIQDNLSRQKAQNFQNNLVRTSHKCNSCSSKRIEAFNICKKCQKANFDKNFQQLSKQLESSIFTIVKQKLELNFNTKIKEIDSELRKEITILRLQSIQQADKIKFLLNQNQNLKQSIKENQTNAKLLQFSMKNTKQNIEIYQNQMKIFEKDFKLLDEINFELQNKYTLIQHKVETLSKNIQSQKINPEHQFRNEQKNQKAPSEIPNLLNHHSSQSIKAGNPSDIKVQEKKTHNYLQKEQIQKLFANPKFQDSKKSQFEGPRQELKPLNASIQECQKFNVFIVGEAYQPKLKITNIGSKKWPSQVFIFQKDSKRMNKIPPLSPNQEYIFTDDFIYVGQREGQNIQIKYQLYYEQNGQKMYIGLPISIFLKVKKIELEKQESVDSEQSQNEDKNQKMNLIRIDSDKLNQSRIEVESYQKRHFQEVESQIKKSGKFIKMINDKKRQLNLGYKITKDIKATLEEYNITQQNFEQCDSEFISQIIKIF